MVTLNEVGELKMKVAWLIGLEACFCKSIITFMFCTSFWSSFVKGLSFISEPSSSFSTIRWKK